MTPSPSFRHQMILGHLLMGLMKFGEGRGLGEIVLSPMDVILSAENVVQPDLLFIAKERRGIINQHIIGAPDLTVEILSPSTAGRDLVLKRKLYAKFGVREYWIVDPEAQTIEVLTPTANGLEAFAIFSDSATMSSPLLPGLSLPLDAIFRQ